MAVRTDRRTHLPGDEGRSLSPQLPDRLEHVHPAHVLQLGQQNGQRTEHATWVIRGHTGGGAQRGVVHG